MTCHFLMQLCAVTTLTQFILSTDDHLLLPANKYNGTNKTCRRNKTLGYEALHAAISADLSVCYIECSTKPTN